MALTGIKDHDLPDALNKALNARLDTPTKYALEYHLLNIYKVDSLAELTN